MTNYLIRRLVQTSIVMILLSYFCFGLMALMPGDPVDLMVSSKPNITSADVARLKALYGLDRPIYERYYHWAKDFLHGDLGYSRTYKIPVGELLGPRLLNTFLLSSISLIISLIVAIPLGIFAALHQGKKIDYLINFYSFAGISVPSFWLAIVLIILFAVWIPLFPAGGTVTIGSDFVGWPYLLDRAKYLFLPVCSLTLMSIGSFVRFTRAAMLDVLRQDYMRTARAKGLNRWQVIIRHGLRNALIPLITIISLSMSTLFSGAVITETVFAYQGVGHLILEAINGNDYNVAMVSFMISVAMVLIMNLVADVLYACADPRISYH